MSVAGTFAIGLLNVVGAGSGVVFNVVTVALLLGAFGSSMHALLKEQLRSASKRARHLYMSGIAGSVVVLLSVGIATRTIAPVERLPGPSDVAIVGMAAPTEKEQTTYDDLASNLAQRMATSSGGSVRSYPETDDLRWPQPGDASSLREFDAWATKFVDQVGAELLIAGQGRREPSGQVALALAIFVSPALISDASELAGWYALDDVVFDRDLSSASTQGDVLDRVAVQVGEVSTFLSALDAWQSGLLAKAAGGFTDVLTKLSSSSQIRLRELALLFSGHVEEASAAQTSDPQQAAAFLTAARSRYEALLSSATVGDRAKLSLAGNDFYLASRQGCNERVVDLDRLTQAAGTLEELIRKPAVSDLQRLKARVNLLQVDRCRQFAGSDPDPAANESRAVLLAEAVSADGPEKELRRQIKALALSDEALRLRSLGIREQRTELVDQAVERLNQALALDSRFERQALWLGLKSAWQLARCRIREGMDAQSQSQSQRREAVRLGRTPQSELARWQRAFETDQMNARDNAVVSRRPLLRGTMFERSAVIRLAALSCCLALLTAACQGDPPREGSNPRVTAGTSPPSSVPTPGTSETGSALPTASGGGDDTTTTSEGAESLALAEQIELLAAGNGAASDCAADLEFLPAEFADSPSVWISPATGLQMPVEFYDHAALCLHGFDASRPIAVQVKAGTFTSSTTVVPTAGEPNLDTYLPPGTLFENGPEVPVYSTGADLLMSEMWMFVTTAEAREQFARGERLSLTATQPDRQADGQQEVAIPTRPSRSEVDGLPDDETRLLIYGFTPGQMVPIGLYRADEGESAQLVARLGSVRIPAARVAEYDVSVAVLQGRPPGEYCVTVPLEEQFNCPPVG